MAALKNFNVVDLFCGLGGASQGMLHFLQRNGFTEERLAASGYRLRLINVNHWEVAIDTVKRNIAFAELFNAKIEDVDPTFALKGEQPHFVIAAPECIMHSVARGNKPIKDQSRTTAAWVLDWIALKPLGFFMENVPEWKNWGPLDERMRPIKEHRGEFFEAFVRAIQRHGYGLRHEAVVCANYGDPTIRKRLFIIGLRHDVMQNAGLSAVAFPEPTHTKTVAKHPNRKPWRVAREIIDWNLKGRVITHRAEGLHAPATLRRQRAGFAAQTKPLAPSFVKLIDRLLPIAEQYHRDIEAIATKKRLGRNPTAAEVKRNAVIRQAARERARKAVTAAYAVPIASYVSRDLPADALSAIESLTMGQHGGATAHLESEPIATVATKGAVSFSEPFLVKANASEKSAYGDDIQPVDKPLQTVVTKDCRALADPLIAQLYSSNVEHGGTDSDNEPLGTVTAGGIHHALSEPIIANIYGVTRESENRCTSTDEPLQTVVAGGKHQALSEPFIAHLQGQSTSHSVDEPVSSITTEGTLGLVESFIVPRNNAHGGGDRRAIRMQEPIQTITGSGAGALADPILAVVQHGKDDVRQPQLDEPMQTITGKGSCGVADPVIVPQDYRAETRTVDTPTPTATTIARIGLAEAVITSNHFGNAGSDPNEPLSTATTATGGGFGLAEGFITPNFGEREGQAPRVHPLSSPAPSVTSHGAGMLSEPVVTLPEDGPFILIDGVKYGINILYRMLTARELARAHSLENVVLPACEKDAVKLVGNSIPKETSAALIGAPMSIIFDWLGFEHAAVAA